MLKIVIITASLLCLCFIGDAKKQKHSASRYKDFVKALSTQKHCDLECIQTVIKNVTSSGDESVVPSERLPHSKQSDNAFRTTPHEEVDPVTCASIPTNLKFDCYPDEGASEASCLSRGCCWDSTELNKDIYTFSPRAPPSCFYPPNYSGYQFRNFSQTVYLLTVMLERTTLSGHPEEISTLKMDVYFETESRIRIRLINPSEERWESPVPVVPDISTAAANLRYSFVTEDSRGEFAVIRVEDGQPLFDTRGAGQLVYANQFIQISSFLASEYLYGLGQHLDGLLLDTYWHRRVLWNHDQLIQEDTNLYGSHPFYLVMENSGKAHGVFLLNSNTIDAAFLLSLLLICTKATHDHITASYNVIIQPTPAITLRTLGGIVDLYVFLGPTPSDVIQQYTDVIGKPFLPPYWSLGYHQCRWNYKTLEETRRIWEQTRNASIPFDVQWNDIDSLQNYRIFTYDQEMFQGLPEFVDELHSVDMKYVPIVDPGLGYESEVGIYPPVDEALETGVVIMDENGQPYHGTVWPGNTVWPDFTNPDAVAFWTRQLDTYQDLVAYDGIWVDMNEPASFDLVLESMCNKSNLLNSPPYAPPVAGGFLSYRTVCMSAQQYAAEQYFVHNLYGITHCIATNIAMTAVTGKRPFILTRSTFPGVGSYSSHWTGDSLSTFGQMYSSIADILNFNLYGVPMVGADICGFSLDTTVPLCVKWYLLGAFYPFARNHNSDLAIDQDPVSLGEPVITVARNSLTERYRLLPYLFSLFFRAHMTGEPVARPLFYEFPEDKNTYSVETAFMWGQGLLIAPALENETFAVTAYIPRGLWYDWYDGRLRYDSAGQYEDMVAPEDTPNLFMRGGTIIPHQKPGVTTTESRLGNFGLEVALDSNQEAEGELFWDDGYSTALNYNEFHFTANIEGLSTACIIDFNATMILANVRVMGLKKQVSEVTVGGDPVGFNYTNNVLTISGFQQNLLEGLEIRW